MTRIPKFDVWDDDEPREDTFVEEDVRHLQEHKATNQFMILEGLVDVAHTGRRCFRCGDIDGVYWHPSRISLAKRDVALCGPCAEKHHEKWSAYWRHMRDKSVWIDFSL